MDFQKNKTLLDKINALYKNISSDPANVSSIEMDLMKSYIRQFYEVFLDLPTETAKPAAPTPVIVEPKHVEPRITLRKPETTPPPPPPLNPQPEPPRPEPPKVERAPEPAPAPPPPPVVVAPPPQPVVVAPPPPPIVVEATPPPAPTPAPIELVVPKTPTANDPEIDELFAFKSATELSEKLSELPITDIKKAMGLNERITAQNDLFIGDAATFDATIATLNQLRSYEEAKDYLVRNVAGKFNWTAKDKKEKAKAFIKLVRRRY